MIKFSTSNGIGEQKGDQATTRDCYVATLKEKRPKKTFVIDALEAWDDNEEKRAELAEKLEKVQINSVLTDRTVSIGSSLRGNMRDPLIDFLKWNEDIFAWSHANLTGIDPSIMSHHLNIDPNFRPVKQKPRVFGKERSDAVLEEVPKLRMANFIREIQYPDWLANVVLVKKSNGKWRLCVNFKDLNKSCPKDSYPLP